MRIGKERPPYYIALLNVAALTGATLAVSWLLTKRPELQHLWLTVLGAVSLLTLIEAAMLRSQGKVAERRLEDLARQLSEFRGEESPTASKIRDEHEKLEDEIEFAGRRERLYWGIGAALISALLGSIPFSGSASGSQNPCPNESCKTNIQFSDQLEGALVDYLTHNPTQPPPNGGIVRLDPELEATLRQHIAQKPDSGTGTSPWVAVALVLLAIGLVGIVWWSLHDKPEATPLTLAIATLTAVSAAIEKLSPKGGIPQMSAVPWPAKLLMLAFAVAALMLLLRGVGSFLSIDRSDDPPVMKSKSLIGACLLVFGFSAALLALVPAMLFHSEVTVQPPQPCPKCPETSGVIVAPNVEVLPLSAVDNLGDGRGKEGKSVEPAKILPLTKDLKKYDAKPDDILLLLGSADCIPTKPISQGGLWEDNAALANARADWVKTRLDGQSAVKYKDVQILPLPQYARCGLARNLRAVYPFLIHAQ